MAQLENIEAIEKRLWNAADTLRANSNYASNEYFMPVMGLIFLRHAYSRYLAVKDGIEAGLPKRGGKARPLTTEDFSQKGAIFLRPEAQFDYLVSLPDSAKRDRAIQHAMDTIEEDYDGLKGVLPKGEYSELDNDVLGQLLRTLNPEELKQASGDIFGRIYEYFLTQFADLKAHDNGEFFTPVSLVRMITNVIEPDHGKVLDPACGSGGMFVQSAHFVERMRGNPSEALTFYGMEKNPTTIRLAKMNLAVHGLEGDIQKAITYYEDPHELVGKADFVMANPPFNVDEVDADKIKNDPRLPFGLPGVNKAGKVSNGNYLWISYFHSYLSAKGRAGFVMSSQASSAGHGEKAVRQKLVESGDVDVMISIRSNFFYTRTVPCELWFFDRAKPTKRKDQVLMLDARNVYRKVTRKIYDFSPEQMQNLSAIVWLYRGQQDRFLTLVKDYLGSVCAESAKIPAELAAFDARDLVEHYSTAWETGKAMLVCIDKVTCVRMCNLIKKYWSERMLALGREKQAVTDEQEEIYRHRQIQWMEETRMAVVVSEEQGEVDKFRKWELDITPHRRLLKEGFALADGKRIDLDEAFKKEGPPLSRRDRVCDVADRLRRAQSCHALPRQAAQGSHVDAGHRPRQPRERRQEQRPDRRLLRHPQESAQGAGDIRRKRPTGRGRRRRSGAAGRGTTGRSR